MPQHEPQRSPKNRKPIYSTPKLTKYGDFKKLTGGVRRSGRETTATSTNKTRSATSSA
jgi:hypothetical protein